MVTNNQLLGVAAATAAAGYYFYRRQQMKGPTSRFADMVDEKSFQTKKNLGDRSLETEIKKDYAEMKRDIQQTKP